MATHKINATILLLIAMFVLFTTISNAQNSPQDFLNSHNSVRRKLGIPDLTWDTTLEAYARNYANSRLSQCNLVHSGGKYGENLAWGYYGHFTAVDAVKMWADEKANYNYNSNTCAAGKMCGHYTQIVWRNTKRVGCYRARCTGQWTNYIYVICSYDPPGNWPGQWPYNSYLESAV